METLAGAKCQRHDLQASRICANQECFGKQDILVCPNCSSRHLSRQCQLIDLTLLDEKVHELMQKRVEFELSFRQGCDQWLDELRKFKMFKQEILTILNAKERTLNDICRQIRRSVPYEKDKQLFKKHYGYLYLATRGINPNFELYQKFNDVMAEGLNECTRVIHRLRLSRSQVPTMLKRQHQISALLASRSEDEGTSIPKIQYCEPKVSQFKKETIKYKKSVHAEYANSSLFRLGDEEFLTYNNRSKVIGLYSRRNLGLGKTLYVGSEVEHVDVVGKYLFASNGLNNLFVIDLLNEQFLKEYASSNHPQASVTSLLALSHSTILNFVHNPNQIVAMHVQQQPKLTLKVRKGQDILGKCLTAQRIGDSCFVGSFDDKAIRIFHNEGLQFQHAVPLDNVVRSVTLMDENNLLAGGESEAVWMIDRRQQGIMGKFSMGATCYQLKKIYPNSFLANLGNCLKIYDCRMHKQVFKLPLDNPVSNVEVLCSHGFVTSGRELSLYQGLP